MKATIIGKQLINFPDPDTGEVIEGVKLYYTGCRDDVQGLAADSLFIRSNSRLYEEWRKFKLNGIVEADIIYDMQPGRKRASLTDIIPVTVPATT